MPEPQDSIIDARSGKLPPPEGEGRGGDGVMRQGSPLLSCYGKEGCFRFLKMCAA